jgi:hypothetical protein
MGLKKDIIEADVVIGSNEAQASLAKLQNSTSKLTDENKRFRQEQAKLVAQGKKNSKEYRTLTDEIKKNEKTIKDNRSQMNGLRSSLGVTQMTAKQLRKRARELRREMDDLTKSADPARWNKLNDELDETTNQLDRVKAGSQKTKGVMSNLVGTAKGLFPAFGWTAIIAGAVAAGKALYNMGNQIEKNRQHINRLTGESGQELADLTVEIQTNAEVWEKGFEEMAIANHNFAESMNISEQAATALINKGFVAGADASGEFLDQLREYGPLLKEAGYSADEAIALMSVQVKQGVFSDKGIDAIKEAHLSLREMPKTAKDALAGIGLSGDEIKEQLRDGTLSMQEAISMVSKRISELPPHSNEVGTAIADIFKGAGEDAGLEFIKGIHKAEDGLDSLVEKSGEVAKEMLRLREATNRVNRAWSALFGDNSTAFISFKAGWKEFWASFIEGTVTNISNFRRDWKLTFAEIGGFINNLKIKIAALGVSISGVFNRDNWKKGSTFFTDTWDKANQLVEQNNKETADKTKQIWVDWTKSVSRLATPKTPDDTNDSSGSSGSGDDGSKNKKSYDDQLKALQTHFAKEQLLIKQNYIEKHGVAELYMQQLEASELKHLQARVDLAKAHKKESSDLEIELWDMKISTIEEASNNIDDLLEDIEATFDAQTDALLASQDKQDQQLLAKNQAMWDKINQTVMSAKDLRIAETEKEYYEMIAFAEKQGAEVPELYRLLQEKLQEINDEYDSEGESFLMKMFGLTTEQQEELMTKFEKIMKITDQLGEIWGNYYTFKNNKENESLRIQEQNNEKSKASLKKQLDSGRITYQAYSSAIEKMDNSLDAKKKNIAVKQAKRERRMAVFQILSDTAIAVMKVWGQTGLGGVLAQALPVAAGAAAILSLPPVPQNAKGNLDEFLVRGQEDGKAYRAKNGGKAQTGIYSGPTLLDGLGLVGEASNNPREIVIDGPTTDNILMNYPGIMNAINAVRVPQYAGGTYKEVNNVTEKEMFSDPALIAAISRFSEVADRMMSEGIESNIVYQKFEDFKNDVDSSREAVSR